MGALHPHAGPSAAAMTPAEPAARPAPLSDGPVLIVAVSVYALLIGFLIAIAATQLIHVVHRLPSF